jgi:hypothetical protein
VVSRVLFALPEDFRFVRKWIAYGREAPLEQGSISLVFRPLRLGLQRVERKQRPLDGENLVNKRCPIDMHSGQTPNSLSEPLGRFEDSVKVVVLQQLGAAVLQHFGMNSAALELRLDRSGTRLGLVQCAGSINASELAVLSVVQSRERENGIQLTSVILELIAPTDEPGRSQEGPDEIDHLIGAAMFALRLEKDQVQAAPLS